MSMCICKVTFRGFDTRKMNSFKLLEIYRDTFYFKVKTKNYWIFPLPTASHSFLTWFKEEKISKSLPRVIKRAGVYCVSAFWTFIVNSSRRAARISRRQGPSRIDNEVGFDIAVDKTKRQRKGHYLTDNMAFQILSYLTLTLRKRFKYYANMVEVTVKRHSYIFQLAEIYLLFHSHYINLLWIS